MQSAISLQFVGSSKDREAVYEGLTSAGLEISDAAVPYTLICFDQATDAVHEAIAGTPRRHTPTAICLALCELEPAFSWSLLAAGAADVLEWTDLAPVQIARRLERWRSVEELLCRPDDDLLAGDSPPLRRLKWDLAEAAHFSNIPILITGESGTGKELAARFVHKLGGSNADEAVAVDCATLQKDLMGSELFGHERGAFTGAVAQRDGAFALADQGTLFLDEVGELPLELQAHLLRVLQEKSYKRIGSNLWQRTDFRLVCATNRDLAKSVGEGTFRLDLYHRLSGWTFEMPPLRSRREDILPLAEHFWRETAVASGPLSFDAAARDYLVGRDYAGNVRELRQLVQRIAARHTGQGAVTAADIPMEDRPRRNSAPAWPDHNLEDSIDQAVALGVSLREISEAVRRTAQRIAVQREGSLQKAAKRLGVTDRSLQKRRAAGALGA